jgi:hypothetical protein
MDKLERQKKKAAASAAPDSAGNLFAERSWDFGAVKRGPVLSHSFRLTNPTKSPIQIETVRTTCGFVTVGPTHLELAPGEEKAIVVHVDSSRFSGPKTITLFVEFSKPQAKEVQLRIKADSRD